MRAGPDLIRAVVAFRQWRLADDGLWSLRAHEHWGRGVLTARCRAPAHAGPAPQNGCTCGFYAGTSRARGRPPPARATSSTAPSRRGGSSSCTPTACAPSTRWSSPSRCRSGRPQARRVRAAARRARGRGRARAAPEGRRPRARRRDPRPCARPTRAQQAQGSRRPPRPRGSTRSPTACASARRGRARAAGSLRGRAPADRLAARALELVDVASESRDEAALAAHVLGVLRDGGAAARDAGDTCILAGATERGERPLVLLAGHLDTVPAQGNLPGRRDDDAVHGLGAADMKGALAVMVELALARRGPRRPRLRLLRARGAAAHRERAGRCSSASPVCGPPTSSS